MNRVGGSVAFGDGSSGGIGGGIGDGDPGGFAGNNEGAQLPQNAAPSGFGLPHFLHAGIQVTLTSYRTIIHALRAVAISKFTPCALLRYQSNTNMVQSQHSRL
jgi:hypothetical protein